MRSSTISIACVMLLLYVHAAHGQQTSPEAGRLSNQVLAKSAWLAEADKCPASIMAKRETPGGIGSNVCEGAQLGSCLAKCDTGNARSCYWLAHQFQKFGDKTRAPEALYQRACKLGVMSGCTNRAAGMLAEKRDDPSIQSCTADTFSRACAFDDPWACTMYAFQLGRGMGVARDNARALEALKKSCKNGAEDPACQYAKGVESDLTRDTKQPAPQKK
jgi:hypothetical protein